MYICIYTYPIRYFIEPISGSIQGGPIQGGPIQLSLIYHDKRPAEGARVAMQPEERASTVYIYIYVERERESIV